jgi:hypothetical protein
MSDRWDAHRKQCAGLSKLDGGFLCDLLTERDALAERNSRLVAALREINSDYCDELRRVKCVAMLALGDDERRLAALQSEGSDR